MSDETGLWIMTVLIELGVIILLATLYADARRRKTIAVSRTKITEAAKEDLSKRVLAARRREGEAKIRADLLRHQLNNLSVPDLRVGEGSFVAYGRECRLIEATHDVERGWTLNAVDIASLRRAESE